MSTAQSVLARALAVGLLLGASALPAAAGDRGMDRIGRYIKTTYGAKRRSRFGLWVGGLALKVARPDGLKSFKIQMFDDVDLGRTAKASGLDAVAREGLGADWSPIVHVVTRSGEQTHVYARWRGEELEVTVVAVDAEGAALVRARIAPEKLRDVLGSMKVNLSRGDRETAKTTAPTPPAAVQ